LESRELEIDIKMILCLILAGGASLLILSGCGAPDHQLHLCLPQRSIPFSDICPLLLI
jgi:hypothetical protein